MFGLEKSLEVWGTPATWQLLWIFLERLQCYGAVAWAVSVAAIEVFLGPYLVFVCDSRSGIQPAYALEADPRG